MPFVVTMDQRRSRASADLVEATAATLNAAHAGVLTLPFVRTAGDEIQAVAADPGWLVDLLLAESRAGAWWVGVGVGDVEEPLGATARDSRGEAFYRARAAVDRAKRRAWGFAIDGPDVFTRVEDALVPLSFIVRRRTPRQQEIVTRLRAHGSARTVARQLGVAPSTISESLRSAGHLEEQAGRRLVAALLGEAVGAA